MQNRAIFLCLHSLFHRYTVHTTQLSQDSLRRLMSLMKSESFTLNFNLANFFQLDGQRSQHSSHLNSSENKLLPNRVHFWTIFHRLSPSNPVHDRNIVRKSYFTSPSIMRLLCFRYTHEIPESKFDATDLYGWREPLERFTGILHTYCVSESS